MNVINSLRIMFGLSCVFMLANCSKTNSVYSPGPVAASSSSGKTNQATAGSAAPQSSGANSTVTPITATTTVMATVTAPPSASAPTPSTPLATSAPAITPLIPLSANFAASCEIVAGDAYCVGDNHRHQLGTGDAISRTTPTMVVGLPRGKVQQIALGYMATCAVAGGQLYCWGDFAYAFNGIIDPDLSDLSRPIAVPKMDHVTRIVLDVTNAWAIQDGSLYCWGCDDDFVQQDGLSTKLLPTYFKAGRIVTGLESGVSDVSIGQDSACVVQSGAVKCWGPNFYGEVGDGTLTPRTSPTTVIGASSGATAVSVGQDHSCALINGSVSCWGLNNQGQIGDGTTTNRLIATKVLLSGVVTQLVSGYASNCALHDRQLSCWGSNAFGLLTQVAPVPFQNGRVSLLPSSVAGLGNQVSAVASQGYSDHLCAISAGKSICWGKNESGDLSLF